MLLVTGATGNVGRELARELDAAWVPFRVLVRDPARAAGLPASAERVRGDLDDPATLAPAFAGADGLFLLTPGIGTGHVRHAVAAAKAAGRAPRRPPVLVQRARRPDARHGPLAP